MPSSGQPYRPEVSKMCHEWWHRRETQRRERFDEEVKYLLDEERKRSEPSPPVADYEWDEEPLKPERLEVEAVRR
jgi:hypothetical protein